MLHVVGNLVLWEFHEPLLKLDSFFRINCNLLKFLERLKSWEKPCPKYKRYWKWGPFLLFLGKSRPRQHQEGGKYNIRQKMHGKQLSTEIFNYIRVYLELGFYLIIPQFYEISQEKYKDRSHAIVAISL